MILLDQENGWGQVSTEALKQQQQYQLNLSRKQHEALRHNRNQIRIRDLHMMLRACTDGPCLNMVVHNYRALIQQRLGADIEATRLSRTPFFYAYNTPELLRENSPWFANTSLRQTYLKDDWGDGDNQHKRLLICITATIPTMNMPLPMFHAYAHQFFNGITYLFDPNRDLYQTGRAEIIGSVRRLVEQLRPAALGFIGVSSGAAMAIRLGQAYPDSRTVSSSPVLKYDLNVARYLTETPQAKLIKRLKILYANNATDLPYQDLFESLNSNNNTISHNLSAISPSHATLATTTIGGRFSQLMTWLNHSSANQITTA